MKPIEITISWRRLLPKRADAMTLWPLILWRPGFKDDPGLRAHEMYHFRQCVRFGVIPWYIGYVLLLALYRTSGPRHPMEKRPYEIQKSINESNKRRSQ